MNLKNRAGTPKQHERIKINSTISRDSIKYAKLFKPKRRIIYATDDNFIKLQIYHDKLTAESMTQLKHKSSTLIKNIT